MKRRTSCVVALAAVALLVVAGVAGAKPGTKHGNSATRSFVLVAEAPNIGTAANGDHVEVTCESRMHACGTFQVHPKALPTPPAGEFVHKDSNGAVVAKGTWVATRLISFHFYGCRFIPAIGVDLEDDNFCGGAVKMRVQLSVDGDGTLPGILTVFCIVGPKAPSSHNTPSGEGVTLVVPGVANFNHTGGGENIFVREG
jgi:hypothetical protein